LQDIEDDILLSDPFTNDFPLSHGSSTHSSGYLSDLLFKYLLLFKNPLHQKPLTGTPNSVLPPFSPQGPSASQQLQLQQQGHDTTTAAAAAESNESSESLGICPRRAIA
jgi:hypothetical protein